MKTGSMSYVPVYEGRESPIPTNLDEKNSTFHVPSSKLQVPRRTRMAEVRIDCDGGIVCNECSNEWAYELLFDL